MSDIPFWKAKSLSELDRDEWESLCDGCGRCCLNKLEDIDSGHILYTNVVCRLFDNDSCRCTRYTERSTLVPDCVTLTPDNLTDIDWLPETCAYRLLNEGRDLPWWHPLVSGTPDTVLEAGISVRDQVISEDYVHVDDWQYNLIDLDLGLPKPEPEDADDDSRAADA
ncbi:YcgN family cysteine cluster protein [Thiohalobacter sp.]|uniref:YcgN family cysteine cluster protein n=1 Tax=Thiohalobacter sp. TaxID=2025948 RepID=UPI002630B128|nr:YcgN family cysteine cluster protein [Thiohalobacter sp.]